MYCATLVRSKGPEKTIRCREAVRSHVKAKLRSSFTDMEIDDKLVQSRLCFFCDEVLACEFHKVETIHLDSRVREMATELRDSNLLAKLSSGDMTATDSIYHKNCAAFYTRHRTFARKRNPPNPAINLYA